MKKEVTHNGITYTVEVLLNHSAERHLGGKVEHLIQTISPNISEIKQLIDSKSDLKAEIEKFIQFINRQFDIADSVNPQKQILIDLGFS